MKKIIIITFLGILVVADPAFPLNAFKATTQKRKTQPQTDTIGKQHDTATKIGRGSPDILRDSSILTPKPIVPPPVPKPDTSLLKR